MPSEKLPHIQFYPGDWRTDVAVQSLSYHHRGIWIEILMLMFVSEDRGRLVSKGKPLTIAGVARLLGMAERDAENAVQVLVESGVASRDENGALISRRMVRDELRRKTWAENGSKGGRPRDAEKPKSKPKLNQMSYDNDSDNGIRLRLGRIFGRRETTAWSEKERKSMAQLTVVEDDLAAVERYYSEKIPDDKNIRRRDLLTLLNNWPGEVDRARARPKPRTNGSKPIPRPTEPPIDPVKRADFQKRLSEWKAAGRPLGEFP